MCHRTWLRVARQQTSNLDIGDQEAYGHLPGTDAPGPGFHEGYLDAIAGRSLDYDFGERAAQQAYEDGFFLGSALVARGLRIAWPDRRVMPAALIAAVERVMP
jgi:hypothetical protein